MPAFYSAILPEFLHTSESEITGILTTAYAKAGFTNQKTSQTKAWVQDLATLQTTLAQLAGIYRAVENWTIVLEFEIPRKDRRIDVVLLAGENIILLELKSSDYGIASMQQVEDYALLLHYFHRPSYRRKIRAFVVTPSTTLPARSQLFLPLVEAARYWIPPVEQVSWKDLGSRLSSIAIEPSSNHLDPIDWLNGEYFPVPSIIEAARSLREGLSVREIAHSHAAQHDVEHLTQFVHQLVDRTKTAGGYSICFITGVPGSGKTLVGLNMALATQDDREHIHFMSGTGPLVDVLQAVLAQHQRKIRGTSAAESMRNAKTLIENVHRFAKHYTENDRDRPPSNHVIIFDEAQRAWNKEQNLLKFRRPYSEPEMLLSIMERHKDWAVVIALVGGGQEINSGEAGIEEWGRALTQSPKLWNIYVSPVALQGGDAVAGSKLFSDGIPEKQRVFPEEQLHLNISVRNLNAESYSSWVNHVVNGDARSASALNIQKHFPVILVRSLRDARTLLAENAIGESRCGLVGSSNAARLRADGLEPSSNFHANYPWSHWYLGPRGDVRSSYQQEVFATEFEIQGLELDWIGLCWGGDFIWSAKTQTWIPRKFHQSVSTKWSTKMSDVRKLYRRNAYRVLLTRARQGIVLYIPTGDFSDPTLRPLEFDETAEFLLSCGAQMAVSKPEVSDNSYPAT